LIKISQDIKEAILIQRKFQSSIGIGEYHPGIRGIVRSFQEANIALEVGNKMNGKIKIHHIANLGISRLFVEISPETRKDFIHNVYKDKINQSGKELKPIFLETLQAFFDNNLNITETAREIYAHRNTLLYRLEKIKQFTGLDPRKFNEAIQLYLALKMKHFQEK